MILTNRLAKYRDSGISLALYSLYRTGTLLVRVTPRPVERRISEVLGNAIYFVWPRRRKAVKHNCARIMRRHPSDPLVARTARSTFRNYVRNVLEVLRFAELSAGDIQRNMAITGLENLEEALRRGRGAIVISCHFGNWEVGGATLAWLYSYPINGVAETAGFAHITQILLRHRAQSGIKIIPVETSLRHIYRALANNEVVGIIIDRLTPQNGVPVRFCGHPTRVPAGVATLAAKTGAAVVPAVFYRLPDGRYQGVLERPLDLVDTGNPRADHAENMARMISALEKYVIQHPDQYYKFQPMWE